MWTVYSAFLLTYAVLMSPWGVLVDRFGPRLVLSVTGWAGALLTGFTALCASLPQFLLVRLGFGVAASPIYPACTRMTANWVPPNQTAGAQAWIVSGAGLGAALSPVAFSALMFRYGWRAATWIAALVTAVLYTVWHFQVRDHPSGVSEGKSAESREGLARTYRFLLGNRNLVLLALSYFCLDYFEYIFYYWIYYYFGEIRHMGRNESAGYVSVLMVAMVVMTPVGGWACDRLTSTLGRKWGRRLVPIVTMTLSAILLFLGASGVGTVATVTLLALALGFCSSAEGAFWASTIDAGGRHTGAAAGFMNSTGNLGGILAPVLTPLIAGRMGWQWGLYFGSLVVTLGVLAWFFIDVTEPVPAEAPSPV